MSVSCRISARAWLLVVWLLLSDRLLDAAEPAILREATADQLASSVLLYGRRTGGIAQATGIVVDAERGWIITAWHFWSTVESPGALAPIRENGKLTVMPTIYLNQYFDGKAAVPRLVWYDSSSDLAVIEVSPPFGKSAAWGRSAPGGDEAVFAFGNPASRNAMWQVEPGRVTEHKWADWTYASGQMIRANLFEFTVKDPLTSGFSGGPVFNAKGEVTGVILASVRPDGLAAYAVETGAVDRLLSRAHSQRSMELARVHKSSLAMRHANLAIGFDSTDPWGYVVRGYLEFERNRTADAFRDWRMALEVKIPGAGKASSLGSPRYLTGPK